MAINGSWDMKHDGLMFGLYPPNNPKNQNFEKLKKMPGDIILQKCTKNQDHMLYYSWDMARDGCNCYLSFWTIFYPFTPQTAQNMKISKKWKKPLEMLSFYTSVPKIMFIRCNCYFSFWAIFLPFYTPNLPDKWKSKKNKKSTCTKNHDHMQYCSWDMACDGCNCYFSFWAIFCPFFWLDDILFLKNGVQWTDRKVTHRGGCPT